MSKNILVNSKNVSRDSFIWNMAGSMLMAFQSVIMLMILTRAVSLYDAGVFTIAYANANLFLNIGKYGMRNYQVSDVNNMFSFKEYRTSRIVSTIAMLIVSLIYTVIASTMNGYPIDKTWIILWMCLFKAVDSIEDVYLGYYQQQGRLDVSGKILTARMILTIILFGGSIIITKNLLISLIITTIITTVLFVIFILLTYSSFKPEAETLEFKQIMSLLAKCFPLFIGAFLAFYIGNAPKYAIDSQLNDELQACYGFIAMPVFVIGLLNNFIFNPMIKGMSDKWNDGDKKGFLKMFIRQLGIVVIITVICEIGAYLIGIPVLSILYNTDLSPYKLELLVLLLGGGFLAVSGLLVTITTIIRYQNGLAIGYAIVALLALIFSPVCVRNYEIMGASVLYLILMIILCIIFSIIFIQGLARKPKES